MIFEEENKKDKIQNSLWCERYRPQDLESYVGNDDVRESFTQYIEKQDIPHLLLFGSAGTGKCLDFSESIDIEIELSDDELLILSKYIVE
jgi:replication-associated recombination protein RarA